MTWIDATWVASGMGLGILHACGIWQSAKQPTAVNAMIGLARLWLVGLALTMAAILGGILPAALGWAVGCCGGGLGLIGQRSREAAEKKAR